MLTGRYNEKLIEEILSSKNSEYNPAVTSSQQNIQAVFDLTRIVLLLIVLFWYFVTLKKIRSTNKKAVTISENLEDDRE